MCPQTALLNGATQQLNGKTTPVLPSAVEILPGIQVHPVGQSDLNDLVALACSQKQKQLIANHNLHSVYLYYHDAKMRDFYEVANCIHTDGMGVILLARLLGIPLARRHRTTFVDWFQSLFRMAAERGFRVFYLGSKPGIAARGTALLRARFPALQMSFAHGYFDPCAHAPENDLVLDEIFEFKPHILMVGMGMPRQERWIFENYQRISANVILPVGAAIDYVAGAIPTPPRWAGHIGFEWFFRLLGEPRRLWSRYLLEPWFILRVAAAIRFKSALRMANRKGPSGYQPGQSEGGADS